MTRAILPSIVSFSSALVYLGIECTHAYSYRSVSTLIRLINEHELPMYLVDAEIYGSPEMIVREECYEDYETGRFNQFEPLYAEYYCTNDLYIRLTEGVIQPSQNGDCYLDITEFELEGTKYYSTNNKGMLAPSSYSFDCFYFCLQNLEELKRNLVENPERKLSTAGSSKSKQSQRELAFKFWLGSHRGVNLGADKQVDFQDCYDQLQSPTQDQVWEKLQKIDAKLFAHGKSDFFRAQSIIDFRIGTGKNRS